MRELSLSSTELKDIALYRYEKRKDAPISKSLLTFSTSLEVDSKLEENASIIKENISKYKILMKQYKLSYDSHNRDIIDNMALVEDNQNKIKEITDQITILENTLQLEIKERKHREQVHLILNNINNLPTRQSTMKLIEEIEAEIKEMEDEKKKMMDLTNQTENQFQLLLFSLKELESGVDLSTVEDGEIELDEERKKRRRSTERESKVEKERKKKKRKIK